jgi:hypothetical protein
MGDVDKRGLNVFTFTHEWFMALFMSLESLRRGQAGALMIGMFITNDTATSATMNQNISVLNGLANICIQCIDELPPVVRWAATPFYDYSLAIN